MGPMATTVSVYLVSATFYRNIDLNGEVIITLADAPCEWTFRRIFRAKYRLIRIIKNM